MKTAFNLKWKVLLYLMLIYGMMTISIFLLQDISLWILALPFLLFVILILKHAFEKKGRTNTLIKRATISLLLIYPLVHFVFFESYLGGQAYVLDAEIFFASARFAFLPSVFAAVLVVGVNYLFGVKRK